MTYQEEEQVRLRRLHTRQAIGLALQGRWREAIEVNKNLIENFPNDVDAYNRLGKAYMELGEYAQAKDAYTKAVELAPYNAIAKKNLLRLSHLEGAEAGSEGAHKIEPQQFIEEVGKAGVVSLFNLSPPKILAKTAAGEKVNLKIEGTTLIVDSEHGEYLGQVEAKHAQRLIKLMEGGNRYEAAIISLGEKAVTVIIREVYQDPSQAGQLSFPPRKLEVRPYAGDRMVKREPEYEEGLAEEPGFTIIAEEEEELAPRVYSGIEGEVHTDEEVI